MTNNLNYQSSPTTVFAFADQRLIYQKFEEIGKKYGDLRESFCRKLYHAQKNAYKSGKLGVQEDNIFWTRMTYKKVAELLNVSLRTAKNVIKDLKEFGIILVGRFKQLLKNFKTGRLMVDNYLAFNIKNIIPKEKLPPPKLSTENPESLVDKGLQREGYGAKFALSYKDISTLNIDNIVGSKCLVDNSNELPNNPSLSNQNKNIKFLLRKVVNFMNPKKPRRKCHRILNSERSILQEAEKEPLFFNPGPHLSFDDEDSSKNDELTQILSNWGNTLKQKALNED